MQSFVYFKFISHALLHQKKTLPEKKFTIVTGLKQIRKTKMQWKVIHNENMPYMPENVLCAFILFFFIKFLNLRTEMAQQIKDICHQQP